MAVYEFPYFTSDDGNLDPDGRMRKQVLRVEADTHEEALEKAVEALYGNR